MQTLHLIFKFIQESFFINHIKQNKHYNILNINYYKI